MSRLFRRSLAFRVAVALFALWLPAVTGSGGRATAVAMHGAAKSWTAERPHLSCHDSQSSVKKDCCCRGKTTLRAAACRCHDGDPAFGTAPADPTVGGQAYALRTPVLRRLPAPAAPAAASDLDPRAPDSPPPRTLDAFA